MACALHPSLASARNQLAELPTGDLVQIATGSGPVTERAIALWYVIGTDRGYFRTLHARRGEPRVAFDWLCEAGFPHTVVELAREGFRRTGEMLSPFVTLLSRETCKDTTAFTDDEAPPETDINGLPGWALDLYSREGRAAFATFLQLDVPSARWIRGHVPGPRRIAFLGQPGFPG